MAKKKPWLTEGVGKLQKTDITRAYMPDVSAVTGVSLKKIK